MRPPSPRAAYAADLALRRLAVAETVTLVLLLANLATVHTVWVTRPVGALHGALVVLYTALCLVTRWTHRWPWWLVAVVAVPVVGPLVLLEVTRRDGTPAGALPGPDARSPLPG